MGTTWSVKLVAPRGRDLHPLHAVIQGALDRVVAQMSTWDADSDITRFNRAAAGTWQRLPDAFHRVLTTALEIARASDGAFDPTVGPMVDLWGFGAAGGPRKVPSAEQIALARQRCGWQRLHLEADRALQPGALALDLSGIAKGFGVDCVQRALAQAGIASALIDVGGELFGYGRKPMAAHGVSWWNQRPTKTQAPHCPRACWHWMAWPWPPPVTAGTASRPAAYVTRIPSTHAWARRLRRQRPRSPCWRTMRCMPMPGQPQ